MLCVITLLKEDAVKFSTMWYDIISKEEYIKTSESAFHDPYNDRPPPEVQKYIDLVKSGKIKMTEVPTDFVLAVKARI